VYCLTGCCANTAGEQRTRNTKRASLLARIIRLSFLWQRGIDLRAKVTLIRI
jgi:hypothetical protein